MEYFVAPWKTWNQLDDWVVDRDGIDENKQNNCGMQCVAMAVWAMYGVELNSDYIKDLLYGDAYLGYTSCDKLAYYFRRYTMTPTDIYANVPFEVSRELIVDAVRLGQPVIALQYWRRDQPNSGHFVCVIRVDDNGLTVSNPYGGKIEHMDWYTFSLWHKGWLVIPRPSSKRGDLSA